MTKICHYSDRHFRTDKMVIYQTLPPADLYICTGDCLPTFILAEFAGGIWDPNSQNKRPQGPFIRRIVDPGHEEKCQKKWIEENPGRKFLGNQDAPVICVRGNHEFTDLAPWFGGEVYEIQDPTQVFEINGIRFGGMRGVPVIGSDVIWSDEIENPEATARAEKIPNDIDVLVTHAPPYGVLDQVVTPRDPYVGSEHLGCRALRFYINRHVYGVTQLKLHCFGHIHEARGIKDEYGIQFSNAATTYQEFDISLDITAQEP